MTFPLLFSPVAIGGMTLSNRIAMAPMSLRIPDIRHADGTPSDKLAYFWETRAKGGVGLIVTDVLTPDPDYGYMGPTLALGTAAQRAAMRRLTEAVHRHGTKIVPQLTHPGPASLRGLLQGAEVVGPSKDVNRQTGTPIRSLRLDEIARIVEQYGDTAEQAREAGFDGIELHCAHAYMLLGSFISPARNKRADEYGGTLRARMRLPLEVIANIKRKAGADFPVIVRMSGDEFLDDGNHLPDMVRAARAFAAAGVDALEISGGAYPECPERIMPCHGVPAAANAGFAREIKRAVNVPVLCVGGIRSPDMAEDLIAAGMTDVVVMGRALLADPEWPRKARRLVDSIAPCSGCSEGCLGAVSELHTTCVINPMVGKEREMALVPAEVPRKVVILGGGAGGLMAAKDCALRGHRVTLFEKQDHLGGLLHAASRAPFKQEVAGWIKYLVDQVRALNVDVRLAQEPDAATLRRLEPDAIVIAWGGTPVVPALPGLDTVNWVSAVDVVNGEVAMIEGRVLIVGGGVVGLEVADLLSRNVRPTAITIVESLGDVGGDHYPPKKMILLARLRARGVSMRTSTTVGSLGANGVVVCRDGEETNLGLFDHVVIACGFKARGYGGEFDAIARESYVIGDAARSGSALEAIARAAEVARQI